MLRSILIGLDGSPDSMQAVDLGIRWANKLSAQLVGLGIVDEAAIRQPELVPVGEGYYSTQVAPQLLAENRRKVENILDQFTARCAAAGVNCSVLEDVGLPYAEILRESQRYDLVLFGHETHFRGSSTQRADETLWTVLKNASRPVVVVPPTLPSGSSVMVAYNGSPQADRALQAFQASGLDLRDEVSVITVDADADEGSHRVERATEFLLSHGISATAVTVAPTGTVAQTILEEVRRRNARLLVMGAYGRSVIREFLLGSITNAVVRDSPTPVFLCH